MGSPQPVSSGCSIIGPADVHPGESDDEGIIGDLYSFDEGTAVHGAEHHLLFRAVEHVKSRQDGRVILFSAYGRILNQARVKELAAADHLILICGRYEGVDQRAIDQLVDDEISLGEYVLMGGEIAAEALLEARKFDAFNRMSAFVVHDLKNIVTQLTLMMK